MADTILRQWQMLRLVPRAPRKISTAQLRDELQGRGFLVDQRTVQRDLNKLSTYFALACDNRSVPFGWSWLREAETLDVPGMDVHMALSFRLAAGYLERLLPTATRDNLEPHFGRASKVLDEVARKGVNSWPDKVRVLPPGLPRQPPEIDPEVLEIVQDALLCERRLQVSYCRRGAPKAKTYDVSPLALVHRESIAYLVCTARDYDDVRQLAVHRIESAEVLTESRHPKPDFDIDAYIAGGEFGFRIGAAEIKLEARFSTEAAPALLESPLSTDQKTRTEPDDRLHLTATVCDTNELRVWLRGYGPHVEVLGPQELREELAAEARATAGLYE